jgi:hypothetical protein
MNLLAKQFQFSRLVARLIQRANEMGYELSLSEAWRPEFTAAKYKEMGIGIENSLHRLKLAIDITLFKDGKMLKYSEEYKELGEWWENESTDQYRLCWGGRWKDGCHFSMEHHGVK